MRDLLLRFSFFIIITIINNNNKKVLKNTIYILLQKKPNFNRKICLYDEFFFSNKFKIASTNPNPFDKNKLSFHL